MPIQTYAIPNAPSWWPAKLPNAILDYTLDISSAIDPETDTILSLTAAIAPSGDGEMTASNLHVNDSLITITMAGGVPSRIYTTRLVVTMSDNRIFEFLVYQGVPEELRGYSIPLPPSPSFGTPITSYNATVLEAASAEDLVSAAA